MPYRRSLGRFSKQSWEEFAEEISASRDEELIEGIIAGCALVAYADGWVADEERRRMLGLIRGFEPIAVFGLDNTLASFDALTNRFMRNYEEAEGDALIAVAGLRGKQRYPTLLVKTCCAIAAADGGFDDPERLAVIRICRVLGLDPAKFGIADAS